MADPNEFAFILDSGTPIPEKFSQDLSDHGIQVASVPFKITFEKPVFDRIDYLDSIDVTPLEFYKMMNEYEEATNGSRPTTTQPSPGDFEQVYSQLMENGAKYLIAMPILKEHSGTYNSAVLGSEDLDVRVIDTLSGSAGIMFEMIEGFDAIKDGKSIDEVVSTINNARDKVYINLFVDNPSYVAERLHPFARTIVDAIKLRVKVELFVDEGVITPTRGFSRKRSGIIDKMIKTMENQFGDKPIVAYTLFTDKPEIGDDLSEKMQDFNLVDHPYVPGGLATTALCPAIGRYIGPGGGGVVTYIP